MKRCFSVGSTELRRLQSSAVGVSRVEASCSGIGDEKVF